MIGRWVRPAFAVAGGLMLTSVGLGILTQVDGTSGLAVVVTGSIVFSVGLGPVFILATDLIVGTAPPERAGAASAISETGAEFGGALGIAVLGSIGTAVYRGRVIDAVPDGVPQAAAEAARDTLGGALSVAQQLPDRLGAGLVDSAHAAFTQGLHLTATVGAVVALGVAILVAILLRDVRGSEDEQPSDIESDGAVPSDVGIDAVLSPAQAS
jgi:DHA2 family multidrug resistance protein-like MFS transporter